jgi:hypothetical protein
MSKSERFFMAMKFILYFPENKNRTLQSVATNVMRLLGFMKTKLHCPYSVDLVAFYSLQSVEVFVFIPDYWKEYRDRVASEKAESPLGESESEGKHPYYVTGKFWETILTSTWIAKFVIEGWFIEVANDYKAELLETKSNCLCLNIPRSVVKGNEVAITVYLQYREQRSSDLLKKDCDWLGRSLAACRLPLQKFFPIFSIDGFSINAKQKIHDNTCDFLKDIKDIMELLIASLSQMQDGAHFSNYSMVYWYSAFSADDAKQTVNTELLEKARFQDDKTPGKYLCNLTVQVMDRPCKLSDGETYADFGMLGVSQSIQTVGLDPYSRQPLRSVNYSIDEKFLQEVNLFVCSEIVSLFERVDDFWSLVYLPNLQQTRDLAKQNGAGSATGLFADSQNAVQDFLKVQLDVIFSNKEAKEYTFLLAAVNSRNYSLALRRAASSKSIEAYQFAKILLICKDALPNFNINDAGEESGLTALDRAKETKKKCGTEHIDKDHDMCKLLGLHCAKTQYYLQQQSYWCTLL